MSSKITQTLKVFLEKAKTLSTEEDARLTNHIKAMCDKYNVNFNTLKR